MLTDRIRKAKDNYINQKPHISYERARIWTQSHKKTEGMAVPIRRAQAFLDTCQELGVHIFEGELIVGAIGEYRKCGILTPEFSWTWVDREMDNFDKRVQDPYEMTDEQRAFVREHIFPYWEGKSLEEAFLAQIDPDKARITVDTGIVDNDSKWRQAVGEITPDYEDVLFKKGFGKIEDKVVSLQDLKLALEKDWVGYEELREICLNAPKYGNDQDYVDDIARNMANYQYKTVSSYKDLKGKPFVSAYMGISNYLPTGRVLGATPDGRKATKPISEGVSPYVGTDKSTLLAAMKSAAKLNQDVHSGGTLLNLRMGQDLVATKRGRSNLGNTILSFFSLGAFHVQFNTLSNEALLAAQANPEEYKDLLVRVAGYSTQFVNLSKSMQDAIIARSVHESY